ncbi:hypothetical protein BD289DRAFT_45007 [Coniella lustricola]|uniref:Uncharacterized protein n=1 Tax=Coniella lustricola TaxID=2025994 RepID=A0A2T3A1P1_9PEZI|nr:hypothetical protein BD289DRAFT_45007 [Coniella lustricola]
MIAASQRTVVLRREDGGPLTDQLLRHGTLHPYHALKFGTRPHARPGTEIEGLLGSRLQSRESQKKNRAMYPSSDKIRKRLRQIQSVKWPSAEGSAPSLARQHGHGTSTRERREKKGIVAIADESRHGWALRTNECYVSFLLLALLLICRI